jgi:hypothetical protein
MTHQNASNIEVRSRLNRKEARLPQVCPFFVPPDGVQVVPGAKMVNPEREKELVQTNS